MDGWHTWKGIHGHPTNSLISDAWPDSTSLWVQCDHRRVYARPPLRMLGRFRRFTVKPKLSLGGALEAKLPEDA